MDDKVLIAQYHLGLEAEMFMQSELGRYIQGVSEQEIARCKDELETVDAEDAKAIRRLQNQIDVARSAIVWLREAITASEEAEEMLKE